MATITLKGNPIHTVGELPKVGTQAPAFTLTKTDLSETSLKDFQGKRIVLNIFPSLDTATCAMSVRHFNECVNNLPNCAVLCISADLPFAAKRFCSAENLDNVIPLSVFRHPDFGQKYGVTFADGPLAGLLSRSVLVIDETGNVIYAEQVSETTNEPNYNAALKYLGNKVTS